MKDKNMIQQVKQVKTILIANNFKKIFKNFWIVKMIKFCRLIK